MFNAPATRVWDTLLDPDILSGCIPGCERLTPLGDGRYETVISLAVGPITGRYGAEITLADQEPTGSYRLILKGKGSPGFVRGAVLISLEEQESGTLVKVEGEAQVGGTIAMVGQRLLGSVNKMLTDRFFACLQQAASSGS